MDNNKTKQHFFRRITIAMTSSLMFACSDPQLEGLQLGEERIMDKESENTASMIDAIKEISLQRHATGLVKRFNQIKGLGCFDATFTVAADLPVKLKQGIFAEEQSFPARIRFANATKTDDTEKDFRGMSIKLFNVSGASLWGQVGQQDFLLNSHPALFAANVDDFLDFIEATRDDKVWRYFINPGHFYSLKVVLQGREKITNPLAIRYWSTTPYRYGPDDSSAVKYSVQPCSAADKDIVVEKHQNYLTDVMVEHLGQAPACFDFMIQFQQDPVAMPIENAAVVWDEEISPFIKVAKLTINNQNFTDINNVKDCEAMTFNPWQSLAAHQPLGGINRVRKPVYSEIAEFRRAENIRRSTNNE